MSLRWLPLGDGADLQVGDPDALVVGVPRSGCRVGSDLSSNGLAEVAQQTGIGLQGLSLADHDAREVGVSRIE